MAEMLFGEKPPSDGGGYGGGDGYGYGYGYSENVAT